MLNKWLQRKFIMMVLGVIVTVLQDRIGLSPEQVQTVMMLILGWIGVEGAGDVISRLKKPTP